MTTRFKAHEKNKVNYGVAPLPSGFGGKAEPDVVIPSCGLEDVDVAMFNLFNKEMNLQSKEMKKVPTIFASGEKWALFKRGRALRDKNGTLILPLLTIVRTGISQETADVNGRGINQHTGEIVVSRRLDMNDRKYQDLINRLFLSNQTNLSVPTSDIESQLTTGRDLGDLSNEGVVEQGGLLVQNRKNNVYETIVIPAPQFYSVRYEITIWTQYNQELNQLIEQLLSSFLPQGQCWRLETDKGYWFIATPDGSSWTPENNLDDFSREEKLIRHKFTVNVPAYILASSAPGLPIPVKRYVSAPTVSFDVVTETISTTSDVVDEPFLGSDDPTLPIEEQKNKRSDQRKTGRGKLYVQNNSNVYDPNDPALNGLPRGTAPTVYREFIVNGKKKYVKVNSSGESIIPRGSNFTLD